MFVSPSSGAISGTPRRHGAAEPLDQLEEVVGPVDLVHLAGDRVADDDGRAVDAPRHDALLAHDLLGLELRAVVRVLERLALVEHVLAEDASVGAGDRDRARRGGSSRRRARRRARPRGACPRRSRAGPAPRSRSCRRSPRGGRSGRSCRAAPRPARGRARAAACSGRPSTGRMRPAPPQRWISASSRPIDSGRTSTWIVPSRCSSRSTRCRPMNPVAPVTK